MKKLMRKLSKVANSSHYRLLSSDSARRGRRNQASGGDVPEGHLPVYVGEEMERFIVNAEYLNHPIFVTLLNKSAQEYGYEQGVLRIPCNVPIFERVLEALKVGGDELAGDVQELLSSLSEETH